MTIQELNDLIARGAAQPGIREVQEMMRLCWALEPRRLDYRSAYNPLCDRLDRATQRAARTDKRHRRTCTRSWKRFTVSLRQISTSYSIVLAVRQEQQRRSSSTFEANLTTYESSSPTWPCPRRL